MTPHSGALNRLRGAMSPHSKPMRERDQDNKSMNPKN